MYHGVNITVGPAWKCRRGLDSARRFDNVHINGSRMLNLGWCCSDVLGATLPCCTAAVAHTTQVLYANLRMRRAHMRTGADLSPPAHYKPRQSALDLTTCQRK